MHPDVPSLWWWGSTHSTSRAGSLRVWFSLLVEGVVVLSRNKVDIYSCKAEAVSSSSCIDVTSTNVLILAEPVLLPIVVKDTFKLEASCMHHCNAAVFSSE